MKRTEAEMLAMLRSRHGEKGGNGEASAFITHVRSHAGFDAKRTIDAIAMSLWPSRGLTLDGYEVKCSRSDWLREYKNPAKAEEFCRVVDRFWIVAADAKVVGAGELPDGWGLLVAQGNRLVAQVEPRFLHDLTDDQLAELGETPRHRRGRVRPLPPGFGRSFLACLLREAVRQGETTPEAIREAVAAAVAGERTSRRRESESYKDMYEALSSRVREFEQALGRPIGGYSQWHASAADVGRAVRMVLDGEADLTALRNRLSVLARQADEIATAAKGKVDALDALSPVNGQMSIEEAA